jgi:uncharacterized membrane protein
MNRSKKRAITWTLVALGIAIIALCGVLAATFPGSQQAGFPFAHMWSQGQAVPPGGAPGGAPGVTPDGAPWQGPGGWYGPHYGWGFMRGPRLFGGGLVIAFLVILAVIFAVRRGRYWGYDGRERGLDAEEILRRTFAEGRITEEEYKSRLGALRK